MSLERISYISLPEDSEREIEGFTLSPDIPLPVEPPPGSDEFHIDTLSWEMIISAMLKIFAYRPEHRHIDYYRRFVLAVQPNIVTEMTQTGIVKAKQRDFAVAEEIFRSLVNLAPEIESSHVNLALVLEQRGEEEERHYREEEADSLYDQALAVYTEALSRHPESADIRYNVGHFFLKRGNLHRAKEELTRYLRLSEETDKDGENHTEVERLLGRIEASGKNDRIFTEAYDFIRMGDEERGVERIREFLDKNPEVWNGWFLLGWGLRKLERWKDAVEAFRRSIELEARNVDSYNELAICMMELGMYDEARRRLEEALHIEAENTKIISNLGVLALKRGDLELAGRFFRTVLEIDPDDTIAPRYLEEITSRAGGRAMD